MTVNPATPLPLVQSGKEPLSATKCEAAPLIPSTPSTASSSELSGYILMVISTLGYSGMSFFTHIGENKYGFPAVPSVFVRSVIHTLFTILYMLCFVDIPQMLSRFTTRQIYFLLARGTIGSVGMLCVFTSLAKLPVGDAISIFFCYPVITMLLSAAVLGETITSVEGFSAVLSLSGILLIARPGFNDPESLVPDSDRVVGSLSAIAGAVCASTAYVIVRGLGTSIHFTTSVFSLSVLCLGASTLLGGAIGPAGLLENKEGSMYVILGGLFAFLGQMCLNKALQLCRAGPGALIRNLDVPILYILGLLFLGEKVSWFSLVGTCCVLTSTIVLGIRALRTSR